MNWLNTTTVNKLAGNETHIWRVSINEQLEWLAYWRSLLNEQERSVAKRYHFAKDRQRSIISRGCLRFLLSQYLSCEPQRLAFNQTEHGKPFIPNAPNLFFNVSHAEQVILYAVTQYSPLGIDVENTDRDVEFHELADRFFAASEAFKLKTLTGHELRAAFFQVWTRKEAFVKAIAEGLSFPLKQFEVAALPDESARILSVRGQTRHDWDLLSFIPEAGYQAALVRQGQIDRVNYFSLAPWV